MFVFALYTFKDVVFPLVSHLLRRLIFNSAALFWQWNKAVIYIMKRINCMLCQNAFIISNNIISTTGQIF